MSAYRQIQLSIINVLKDDLLIQELTTGVFDDINADESFPYIVITEGSETRFDTFDRDGKDVTFTLQIFSRYRGYKEVYQILERMNELLNYREITVTGYSTVYLRYENSNIMRDAEGLLRQVNADYRAIVQEN